MTLSLLLDENISPEVSRQIQRKAPRVPIISLFSWRDGQFLSKPDELVLIEAVKERLTLITYDQKTILPLLKDWSFQGQDHGGVIFVDYLTIPSNDIGTLVRSIINYWDLLQERTWTNMIDYLFD
jgi:hypothetical protein